MNSRACIRFCAISVAIGFVCIGEASAFGRRNRGPQNCCPPPCCPPVCCPAPCQPCLPCKDFRDICYCSSKTGSCNSGNCDGPCYGLKDGAGNCYCGCLDPTNPVVRTVKVAQGETITLKSKGLNYGQIEKLLNLREDHGPLKPFDPKAIPNPYPSEFAGTASRLVETLGLKP